jgi:transcriptional regulator with XRE-family HTH domain
MDAKEILAWNLRKMRVAKGLTQEALADEAGLERAYLGRIENGKENITLSQIDKLSTTLGTSVSELFRIPEVGEVAPQALKAGRKKKQ